jgi:hypothetical protein
MALMIWCSFVSLLFYVVFYYSPLMSLVILLPYVVR